MFWQLLFLSALMNAEAHGRLPKQYVSSIESAESTCSQSCQRQAGESN